MNIADANIIFVGQFDLHKLLNISLKNNDQIIYNIFCNLLYWLDVQLCVLFETDNLKQIRNTVSNQIQQTSTKLGRKKIQKMFENDSFVMKIITVNFPEGLEISTWLLIFKCFNP